MPVVSCKKFYNKLRSTFIIDFSSEQIDPINIRTSTSRVWDKFTYVLLYLNLNQIVVTVLLVLCTRVQSFHEFLIEIPPSYTNSYSILRSCTGPKCYFSVFVSILYALYLFIGEYCSFMKWSFTRNVLHIPSRIPD